ncbi:MAG: hypothetical protein U0746_06945 [Gemmataceae bacterium]
MTAATRVLAQSIYAVIGAVLFVSGVAVCSVKTGLLPEPVMDLIADLTHRDLGTLHVGQELGSLMVFAGLISFWFVRHYEQSQLYHVAMTAFAALFSLAHWFDVRGPSPSFVGPLVNTVPFALFAVVGLLRLAAGR